MLRKIREALEERNEGFTLIELLVVVIIIGILAAIAIPVFLSQRERAWRSAMQSDLRNAAVAQETYYTDNGNYAATSDAKADANFTNNGFNGTDDVTIVATVNGTSQSYCLTATHTKLTTETWYMGTGTDLNNSGCTP